mgnify:CR=1 FL=1
MASEDINQFIEGLDNRQGKWRNWQVAAFNKIVFYHIDDQKRRPFFILFFHPVSFASNDVINFPAPIKKLDPKVKIEIEIFLE